MARQLLLSETISSTYYELSLGANGSDFTIRYGYAHARQNTRTHTHADTGPPCVQRHKDFFSFATRVAPE
jgi:hypothetical protein